MSEPGSGKTKGAPFWIAVGCGGALLVGGFLACLAPMIFGIFWARDGSLLPTIPDHDHPPQPTPQPVPVPAPAPQGPGPMLPPPPGPSPSGARDPNPRTIVARVVSATDAPGISRGTMCRFQVERRARDDGTFWCNAQVRCGDRLVYGGAEAGFFSCTLYDRPRRDVVGADPSTTASDRDAAMELNTLEGRLHVWDDATGAAGAFNIEASVVEVQ